MFWFLSVWRGLCKVSVLRVAMSWERTVLSSSGFVRFGWWGRAAALQDWDWAGSRVVVSFGLVCIVWAAS